MSHYIFVG